MRITDLESSRPRAWRLMCALLVVAAAAPSSGPAAQSKPKAPLLTCEAALIELGSRIRSTRTDAFFHANVTSSPTVLQIDARPGPRGGQILTLERMGVRWVSNYRSVGFDPQGDPRWFISVAGIDTAAFFGFRLIDGSRCEVPDAAEFNGAIAVLNERLRRRGAAPIPITFYATPDENNVRVADYVRRFRDDGGIPLARGGNHLVHDLSFHTSAIFFPPEVVRFKQSEAKFLEAFIAWLGRKYAGDANKSAAVRTYAFAWRSLETSAIDNGTGTLAPALVDVDHAPGKGRRRQLLAAPIDWMMSDGKSPTATMDEFILDLNRNTGRVRLLGMPSARRARIKAALVHLPIHTLRSDLPRFTKEYDTHPWLFPDRYTKYEDEAALDRLCHDITARRALIHDVATEPDAEK